MAMKRTPRPRDPVQLGKLMVDIMTGQVPDAVDDGKDAAAAEMGRKGAAARAAGNVAGATGGQRQEGCRETVEAILTECKPGMDRPDPCPAWIFVFEPDASSDTTPNPIAIRKVIGTDSPSFSHYALDVSPAAALAHIEAAGGFLEGMARRLRIHWPELAKTLEF